MSYHNKYLKYKNKYLQYKNMLGGASIKLPEVLIKGPNYMCHLNQENKNIYLFGETHKSIQNITCGVNEQSKTMIEWLQNDVIPNYTNDNILDIFIEQPYFFASKYKIMPLGEKENEFSQILKQDTTYSQMKSLIVKPSKNIRVHTIDIRNEINTILQRFGLLDNMIRKFLTFPNCKEYIYTNHKILLKCIDIVINWFLIMFFNKDNKIIVKDDLTKIITNKLIPYINKLEIIIKNHELYIKHSANIDYEFQLMREFIEEIITDIDFIPITNFNYPEGEGEKIDGLLNNLLFNKIYKKIDEKYKKKFIDLNRELIALTSIFFEKYINFKQLFYQKIDLPEPPRDINILLEEFDNEYIIPDFNNINEVQDIFISLFALFMDVYTIGRLLKPYIKTCLIYAGLSHIKNIYNQLNKIGFNIVYESNQISDITWFNMYDNSKDCVKITNLELHI